MPKKHVLGYISRTRFFLDMRFSRAVREWLVLQSGMFSEKSLEPFSRKVGKTSFLGIFGHVWAIWGKTRFFFKNRALWVSFPYRFIPSCKKLEKSLEPFSRKFKTNHPTTQPPNHPTNQPTFSGLAQLALRTAALLKQLSQRQAGPLESLDIYGQLCTPLDTSGLLWTSKPYWTSEHLNLLAPGPLNKWNCNLWMHLQTLLTP